MSKHHRFLIRRDLHWQWFNALVFGALEAASDSEAASLEKAVKETEVMIEAARTYAKNAITAQGWSPNIGLYFHVYGHNSVNSLHLHIVDLDHTGPTYEHIKHKNLPADAVLMGLRAEANN